MEVVGTAGSVDDAVSRITDASPDLALIDLGLGESGAFDLIERLRATGCQSRMVGVGDPDDSDVAIAALVAGFDAVVTKESRPEHLLASILAPLQEWQEVLAPSLLEGILERAQRPGSEILAELDDQTIELWLLVADGLELARIGEKLHVSERTTKRLVAHLRNRLGVESRLQMAAMASRVGLLDGDRPGGRAAGAAVAS